MLKVSFYVDGVKLTAKSGKMGELAQLQIKFRVHVENENRAECGRRWFLLGREFQWSEDNSCCVEAKISGVFVGGKSNGAVTSREPSWQPSTRLSQIPVLPHDRINCPRTVVSLNEVLKEMLTELEHEGLRV